VDTLDSDDALAASLESAFARGSSAWRSVVTSGNGGGIDAELETAGGAE
jgi:hypothetical protein